MTQIPQDDEALDRALRNLAPPSLPRESSAEMMARMTGAAGVGAMATAGLGRNLAWWKAAACLVLGLTAGAFGDRAYQRAFASPPPDVIQLAEQREVPPQPAELALPSPSRLLIPGADPVVACSDGSAPPAQGHGSTAVPNDEMDDDSPPALAKTELTPPAWDDGEGTDAGYTPRVVTEVKKVAEASAEAEPRRRRPPGDTRIQLMGGAKSTTVGAAPHLRLSATYLGPSRRFARPLLTAGVDLGLLIARPERTPWFLGGVQVGAGLALDGARMRFDMAWTLGTQVLPGALEQGADSNLHQQWLQIMTGPELALVIHNPRGPSLRLGSAVRASFNTDQTKPGPTMLPWFGLTLGFDFPVRSS